jgi:hypothetical protein
MARTGTGRTKGGPHHTGWTKLTRATGQAGTIGQAGTTTTGLTPTHTWAWAGRAANSRAAAMKANAVIRKRLMSGLLSSGDNVLWIPRMLRE